MKIVRRMNVYYFSWTNKKFISSHFIHICFLGALLFLSTLALGYSPSEFAKVTSSNELEIDRIRQQEITQLKLVLGRRFSETRRPDLLLRLAELYIEQYRFYFLKENEIYQEHLKQGQKPSRVHHQKSQENLKLSLNACLAILNSNITFSKMDQVYYFLGYNYSELNREKEASRFYKTLIDQFPNSAFTAEAFRNLAEKAYENRKYSEAVNLYEKAALFKKIASYPRTIYKLAWSYFKTRRYSDALETMKDVVSKSSAEKFVGLREEALRDLVLFFSEAGKSSDARTYFQKISGGIEIYIKSLSRLSKLYEERGDYHQALKVNQALIAEYGSERPDLTFDLVARNVELYRKLNDLNGEQTALNKLVDFFSEHQSKALRSEESQRTYTTTKNYLRARATETHKAAQKHPQKSQSLALYSRAADLYELYSKAFLSKAKSNEEKKELSEVRFYITDCLLAANRTNEAMPYLEKTLLETGDYKYRREAGASLLNILIKQIDQQKNELSEKTVERFFELANEFEKIFPEDPLSIELKFKKARLDAQRSAGRGLTKPTIRTLTELVEKYPTRAESTDAAHDLVADALNRKQNERAAKLATEFLANQTLLNVDKKGNLKKYLQTILSRHAFESVQEIEKDEKYEKAAVEYERLANVFRADKEISYKALNNAAVNFERVGKREDAARLYELALKHSPTQAQVKEDLKRLATAYLIERRFEEAAKLYVKLSENSSFNGSERNSFVRTAFQLYLGIGQHGNAREAAVKKLPEICQLSQESSCHEIAMALGKLLIDQSQHNQAIEHYLRYLSLTKQRAWHAETHFYIGDAFEKLHNSKKARMHWEDSARSLGRSVIPRERNFAAHAAFLMVEPGFSEFQSIRLELPEAKLKAATKKKLSALEDLVRRYQKVVDYGDGEWGIAALERLSDAFSSFADDIVRAPLPPNLTETTAPVYRQQLQQISTQLQARSLEFLKQGFRKGLQLKVVTPTFIALTQRLSMKQPLEHPPAHYPASDLNKPLVWIVGENEKSFDKDNSNLWSELGNLEVKTGRYKIARLLYNQAISLNPKITRAIHNLGIIWFLENRSLEAIEEFLKAEKLKNITPEMKFNYAKILLIYHHFKPALETLSELVHQDPKNEEKNTALAVAYLGLGNFDQAYQLFKKLDASSNKYFALWYNWSVWALLKGNSEEREQAVMMLKNKKDSLAALEKEQVELALSIGTRSMASTKGKSK